ncbi:MAG TPA: amidohydrolase family protein [Actinophytocola sp.]|uniref:amidohydrolase family protein n=1 Tax=Actinophytocola sp. TaxID=1872138 RepID=UPI002DBA5828|nr:amidohydrolase family protein [Actinophytocola sp.]HEU5472202.1 amidohydrolase family protein [Actinophytocola sp.]
MRMVIRGGDVIDTEPEPVVHRGADVLIDNGRIAAVGPNLPADGAEVLDATDRIVLPGFVDTHRHLWQTPLRGLTVGLDLRAYLGLVIARIGPRYRPEDLRVATLAGALECLDAGITTVQDFSHIQYTPEHGEATLDALRESGIRAVYGHGYPVFEPDRRQPDNTRRIRERHFPGDGGPITMALAPVGPSFAPIELAEQDWRLADELDLPIVVHVASGPVASRPVHELRRRGLLRPNTLYVHGNSLPDEELALIADSGAAVSITPSTEELMSLGPPVLDRLRAAGITTGLGADVVTTVAGDMFSVMRATQLTSAPNGRPRVAAADVLRMATLDGARALGLGETTGSLRPGKAADLVLLRTDTVNMVAAHDPITAVVTAAHPGNVDTVLVAGRVVKRDGRLVHPHLPAVLDAVRAAADHLVSP